ncbi:polysaccharide biosynthesis tyrosine autokinase [Aureimonas sp. SK2]|uniref:polysaccharide biosynthesis tyrosine autokinase n=1 Tax=Aureimonas sp. SK2 TaxID=3015992 RepID=UPI002444DFCE|nr:polysaccharide biosynthesis tyrosine autokinase [Aureimonas sp. SK2]
MRGSRPLRGSDLSGDPETPDLINIDRVLAAARRQWRFVAACAVVGAVLGAAYSFTAVPQYTASSSLLIETRGDRLLDQMTPTPSRLEDETAILSQVEILRSRKISAAVVDRLDLLANPAFAHPPGSFLAGIGSALRAVFDVSSWFTAGDATDADRERREAIESLQKDIAISRVGQTSVLEISYTSTDPRLSTDVAQAFADAYLTDQLDAKYEATRRASGWLQDRIEELRAQSLASDQAVQRFRADNNLIQASGQLVSDQQLSQLNSQLVAAQDALVSARARSEQVQSLIESGDMDAVVADSLGSSVVTTLRTRYLEAAKREADISSRLGSRHQQAVRLRSEMSEYRRQMFAELTRVAESYRNETQVASDRLKAVEENVRQATTISSEANEQQVQLRELEREAETYRNLYQTFLQRYQEAIQQQTFPVTGARVISPAQLPTLPSHPRKALVVAFSLLLGLGAGVGLGAYREFRDRFFRTGGQVKESLGLESLGLVSQIDDVPAPAEGGDPKARGAGRVVTRTGSISRYVIDHPLSSFAETLRSAKVAADLAIDGSRGRIIGVASVLPGEGKSTVSANFASLLALQGARTLLIDADLRNPGLTRSLVPQAQAGLVEAILEGKSIAEVAHKDPDTGLMVIPAVLRQRIPHTSDLLMSQGMAALLRKATESFDYVLVDLPPINPVVDARAFAERVDGLVVVVEWGRTARRAVRSALQANPRILERCLGVVLNKVDAKRMHLYQEFGSSEYYSARYDSYYREPGA